MNDKYLSRKQIIFFIPKANTQSFSIRNSMKLEYMGTHF